MRLRKLALAVGLAGTMGAQMASALGLGEIKLYSKLNEPLNAEIRLLQVKDLSRNEVLVELASNDDFKRAGIDRIFFLTDLRFDVVLDGATGPVIRVTSQKPVKEPYLNFLLESQWPNGRILREYTLLMDLPTFSDQRPAPVQSARASTPPAAVPARTSAPAPVAAAPRATPAADSAPAPRTQGATPATAPAYQGEVYGPVGRNDTLWEIALKVRPGRQYSVQQTMLAIQQLNPDAFINGNINLLREGQVLRVPASSDIDSIGAQQAVSEVAQQNSAWSELTGVPVGPQLEGSKRAHPASAGSDTGVSGRLTVGGAGTADSVQSGRASGAAGGDSAALQGTLASSLEELDSARRENAELKDRVAEMEDQIQTMERLLEVSSEEFRALQQNIAARNAEQGADSSEAALLPAAIQTEDSGAVNGSSPTEDLAPTDSQLADEQAGQVAADTAAPAPVVEPPQVQPEAKPRETSRVVQSAPAQQRSFMDLVFDNILLVGAGILAILAAVWFFLRRRQSGQESDVPAAETSAAPVAAAAAAGVAGAATADIDAAIESGVADDFSKSYDDVDLAAADDLFAEDDALVEPQTGDAVAEADIYLSYGKLEQAEGLLQKALEQDPGHTEARLKLLEVFVADQNLDKFDQQLGEVMAFGDAAAVNRAERLRQQFDFAPAYGGPDAENEFALGDETLDLGLDLGDESFDKPKSADASEFQLGEDFGLRFASSLTAREPEVSTTESAEEGLSLELDEAMLAAEEDFLADLELSLDSNEEQAFDLADADAPLTLDLDLSDLDLADGEGAGDAVASDELSLSLVGDAAAEEELEELDLDALADAEDAFDLNMDDMDLAALDEEVSALSENMDFAGEEFGFDEALDLDSALPLGGGQPTAAVADTAADFGELALDDEFSLDSLELDDLSFDGEDLALENKLESQLENNELTLDLEEDLNVAFTSPLEEDEVPTLALDEAAPIAEPEVVATEEVAATDADITAAEPAELELDETDFATFDESDFDESDFEEFDLAADLGLDADEFAAADDGLSEDELFSEALAQLPTPEEAMAGGMNEDDLDAELDFLADTDEAATKLDLARAYIDMGDQDGAKDILSEVVVEGNDAQKLEAEELLTRLS